MTDYLQLARERAAGAPPADESNPYLPLAREEQQTQQQRMRFAIETALKDNPDLAAERQRLSQTSGLPLQVIERNLEEVRRKEALAAIDLVRMAQDSPVLARQLVDPTFTTTAVDDLSTLESLERSVGNAARYVMGAAPDGGLPGALGRGVQAMPSASAGAVVGAKRAAIDLIEPWARLVVGDDNWFAQMSKYYASQAKGFEQQTRAILGTPEGNVQAGVASGALSFAQNAKYLPFALTGPAGGALALGGMVLESFGASYNKAADKNLPLWQALGYASSDAMIEYWTEKIPLDRLIGGIRQGAPFLQTFAKQLGYEIPGEQLATVLQDLNEWATLNPNKPFSDYLAERPDAAIQTLIATVVGTGGNVMVTSGISNILDTISGPQWRSNLTNDYADMLQQQLRLAGQSALRERSPEQFRAHVQAVIENNDGASKAVYVDGEVLNQLPQEVLAQLPESVRQQIPAAAASGSVVEIPMADVLTVAPGTPLEQVLNENARMDPFAASKAEVAAAADTLKQEAERVIQQAADQEVLRASQEAVKANVKAQLQATGRFRDSVNEGYATWASAFYTAYGSRLGMTPEQFYQRYPLRILGAADGQQTGVLNAPGAREFDRQGLPIATMQEVQAVADIPTVEKVQEAIDTVGEQEFARRVQLKMRSLGVEMTPEREAMATEAVAINIVALNRAGQVLEQAARVTTGRELFGDIAQALGLTEQEFNATALEYMTGLPGDMAFLPPYQGGLTEVVAFLHERRLQSGLPPLDINKSEDRAQLARLVTAEALAAIRNAGDSLEWYDTTVGKTLSMMAVKYPELDTDPNARTAFLVAVAIASQGMNVEDNLAFASEQYEAFRTDGKFPTVGKGESSQAMAANFQKANDLLIEMGPDLFRRFLATPFTVRELEQAGFPVGGENKDTVVLGSSIFGPKIGFGFYSNLNGNFEPVTMDMWFMRTIGRLAGTLPAFDPAKFGKQVQRLRDATRERGRKDRGIYASQFDKDLVARARTDENAAIELARQVKRAHEKDFRTNRAAFDAGTRVKTDLVAAAETMLISLEKPKDVPASGGERNLLRDVVAQVVDLVAQNYGQRVPPAALQALIWYPEQEFYKAMGVKLRVTSQDYAGAARKLLESEGFDGVQLDGAAERGAGRARPADGAADAAGVPGDDQRAGRARPLEADERTRFLLERNARILAEQRAAAARIAFEVAPDPNDLALTAQWRQLDQQQRLDISNRVAQQIVPKVLKFLKGKGEVLPQVGSYLEDTNPSFALRVDKGDVDQLSKILGFVLSQDSMMAIAPAEFPGAFQAQALRIEVGEKTAAEIDQIYQALRAITLPDGRQPIAGQSTSGGAMTVLLDSQDDATTVAALVDQALAGAYNVGIADVFAAFPEKQDYDYARVQDDPAGDEGLARQRARDARAEASELLRAELDGIQPAGPAAADTAAPGGPAVLQQGPVGDTARDGGGPGRAIHYSRQPRQALDGRYYGTGLKGLEAERVMQADDRRLRERVYVYLDTGNGVRPEAGVGGYAHDVAIPDNLYDAQANPDGLWRGGDLNATESAILDAGYAGYFVRNIGNGQGAAVIIGPASRGIQVTPIADPKRPFTPAQAGPTLYKRGLMSREIRALEPALAEIQAVAPSAKIRAGTFTVNADELAAARGVAEGLGVTLPDQVLEQGPRGTFNPQTLDLVLNPNADLSTFFHETGHFFLEVLADVASQPGAPQEIADDMAKVLSWFGVPDLATWNGYSLDQKRPYHERWAESIEQYLMEGKAPSAELQPVMRRFRAWLINVYQSIQKFLAGRPDADQIQLNDDIRRVMDRMLATDEQIQQANEVAAFTPDEQADGEAAERLQKRSMADLKWAVKARDKVIAKLKRQAREVEKKTRAEATAEIDATPEMQAKAAIEKAEKDFEADPLAADMNIAVIADSFGFPSVDAMYRAIEAFGSREEAIDALTERRMLEENGDLIDERAIQEAANEAVHNEARARSLATELRTQQEMLGQRTDTGQTNARGARITVNALVEAAKQFGASIVARTALRDLRSTAWKHTAAERRAGKRWQEATAKGDTAEAVKAKRDQVLNNAAAKAALDASIEAKKILEFFGRVTKGNDEKVVEKGRDPDIVNAARAVLAAYGIETPASKGAAQYLERVKQNDPDTWTALEPMIAAATQNAQPLQALTFEELQGLNEAIQAMWFLAKRSRQMEVDGNLLDIDDAALELFARMDEIGIPDRVPGEGMAVTREEERGLFLKQGIAFLRRVEQWAEGMDGKYGGPFLRLVFQPIKDAADRYRKERIEYRKKFQALVDNLAPIVGDSVIEAPELGYTFGTPGSTAGTAMNEILHAIAHTGNDSNKRKLLLGRGWATENADGTLDTTRWDSFIARLVAEGKLTQGHYDFVQGVWDLLEQTKPLAQKAHRDAFGRYFSEVTANEFIDPFGVTRRGGYLPAQVDSRLVKDNVLRKMAEEQNNSMAFSFPQPAKGFTMSRVEYNQPLMLDLRSLSQHIDKVLLFSHMTNPARDVRKLLTRKTVSQPLDRLQPAALESMLQPWLQRSAQQVVETPIVGTGKWARIPGMIRARAGMALMFANVSNTIQQVTGLANAAVLIKPSFMMRALAQYVANPRQFSRTVWAASPYMDDRAKNEVSVLNEQMEAILIKPSTYETMRDWSSRHAYFLQTALDNVISPIIWGAAYNQGLAEGMSDVDAVRFADSRVRQTQGTTLPEDVSRLETGPAYARVFTQFVGYFNMMANTNATALKQVIGEVGLKKGAGKALYIVMMGLMVPIWAAEAIALAFRGGPEDEDDDGYLDDWLAEVFGMGTLKGLLAQIPIVGQFGVAAAQRFNDNPLDDRVSLSPAVSLLEASVGAPQSVYKAIVDEGSAQKAIRDVATLVSVATGVPLYGVARPIGYVAGVAQGKIEPTGPLDVARGLITGTASPESKQ